MRGCEGNGALHSLEGGNGVPKDTSLIRAPFRTWGLPVLLGALAIPGCGTTDSGTGTPGDPLQDLHRLAAASAPDDDAGTVDLLLAPDVAFLDRRGADAVPSLVRAVESLDRELGPATGFRFRIGGAVLFPATPGVKDDRRLLWEARLRLPRGRCDAVAAFTGQECGERAGEALPQLRILFCTDAEDPEWNLLHEASHLFGTLDFGRGHPGYDAPSLLSYDSDQPRTLSLDAVNLARVRVRAGRLPPARRDEVAAALSRRLRDLPAGTGAAYLGAFLAAESRFSQGDGLAASERILREDALVLFHAALGDITSLEEPDALDRHAAREMARLAVDGVDGTEALRDAAEEALRRLDGAFPRDPEILDLRASLRARAGDREESERLYDACLDADPTAVYAWRHLAALGAANGDFDLWLEGWRGARAADPLDPMLGVRWVEDGLASFPARIRSREMYPEALAAVDAALAAWPGAAGPAKLRALLAAAPVASAGDEDGKVAEFTLENDLRVTLRPVKGATTVAVVVVFHHGENADPEGRSGLAHLVEHLYVTAAAGKTAMRTADAFFADHPAGADARTGWDHMAFAVVVPPDRLEVELADAAARMGDLRITKEDVAREIPRLRMEVGTMFDGVPALAARNRVRERLFPTPKGGRKGGLAEHVAKVSVEEAQEFWSRHLGPGAARLVVAGAVDPDAARKQIESLFSPIAAREEAPPHLDPDPTPVKDFTDLLEVPMSGTAGRGPGQVAIGWRAALADEAEYAPFLVAVQRLRQADAVAARGDGPVHRVLYAPLDDPWVLVVTAPLLQEEKSWEAVARLESFVADTLAPPLAKDEGRAARLQLAPLLGTLPVPDAMLVSDPRGLAYGHARRAEMLLDGIAAGRRMEEVTEGDFRAGVRGLFAPARRAAVVVESRGGAR